MGQIKVQKNVGGIEGLCIIEPTVHGDNRGYFMETYNSKDMQEAGIDRVFVQDNQSCSTKGVLRGLHFQKEYPQAKLVRAVKGSVFDVAVDLRSDSKTYGKWFGSVLSVSAKTGEGMAALCRAIEEQFPAGTQAQGELLTNARQESAVRRSLDAVRRALTALQGGLTPDAVLTDAEEALEAVGELTGRTAREEIVGAVFSRFCVGK